MPEQISLPWANMKTFNIRFRFRGHDRFAMVDKKMNAHSTLYSVYFTDVELVLDFGGRMDYKEDGRFVSSKEVIAEDVAFLHAAVYPELQVA